MATVLFSFITAASGATWFLSYEQGRVVLFLMEEQHLQKRALSPEGGPRVYQITASNSEGELVAAAESTFFRVSSCLFFALKKLAAFEFFPISLLCYYNPSPSPAIHKCSQKPWFGIASM